MLWLEEKLTVRETRGLGAGQTVYKGHQRIEVGERGHVRTPKGLRLEQRGCNLKGHKRVEVGIHGIGPPKKAKTSC